MSPPKHRCTSIWPDWLSIQEAARYLCVSEWTVRNRIRNGALGADGVKVANIGKSVRIYRPSLDEALFRAADSGIPLGALT